MSKEVQVELLKTLLDGVIEIGKIVVRKNLMEWYMILVG